MDFSLACDCGATHAVAKGQAGSTIACGCGRLIDVPSLAKLRAQAGLSAVERGPEERIPPLVASGELPGRECAVCRGPCDELFPLTAVCEREEALASSGPHMTRNAPWKFFAGLFAGVLHFEWYERREAVTRGRDTVVYIPLPLCSVCRPQFETRRFYGVVPAAMLGLVAGGAWWAVYPIDQIGAVVVGALTACFAAMFFAGRSRAALRACAVGIPAYSDFSRSIPTPRSNDRYTQRVRACSKLSSWQAMGDGLVRLVSIGAHVPRRPDRSRLDRRSLAVARRTVRAGSPAAG